MTWSKVEAHHWQNNNDKHLIFDKDKRTVSTEDWAKSPISVVVIPMKVIEQFFPDNQYRIMSEDEYQTNMRAVEAILEHNESMFHRSRKKPGDKFISNYRSAVRNRDLYQEDLEKALAQIESDAHKMAQLEGRCQQLEIAVERHQENNKKIFELANKEIQRLNNLLTERSDR